jgi:hypothetical protein
MARDREDILKPENIDALINAARKYGRFDR